MLNNKVEICGVNTSKLPILSREEKEELFVKIKAGGVLGEAEKHNLPNLVGMYYSENCEYRKLIDLTQNFNSNEIELSVFARENLEDMTVENTELITEGYYTRIWATAMLEFSSEKVKYQDVIQDTKLYTVDDALNDNDKKYIVKLVSKDAESMKRYNEELYDEGDEIGRASCRERV